MVKDERSDYRTKRTKQGETNFCLGLVHVTLYRAVHQ